MLRALSIRNIAVAKNINIEFSGGFTVFTGETGAGKSILIDSLELIAGGRASKDMVRSGESAAEVSAIFDMTGRDGLPERLAALLDDSEEIEIVRKFTADGRSSAKINGQSVPVSSLREVSDYLLGISGQSDGRTIADKSVHVKLLDEYIGSEELLAEYSVIYRKILDNRAALEKFKETVREKSMMSDILKYQIKEIDQAKLTDDSEIDKLERVLNRARAAEKILKHVSLIKRALSDEKGAAPYLVDKASSAFIQLSEVMDEAKGFADRLESIKYELIDMAQCAAELIGDGVNNPEETINAAEHRLRQIDRLKSKYGASVRDIIEFKRGAEKKLEMLESADHTIDEYEEEYSHLARDAGRIADEISERRMAGAEELSSKVCAFLRELDMPKVRFIVRVSQISGEYGGLGPQGKDDITFMISANPGEPPAELGRAASGGEIARAMLSLKCALAEKKPSDTYIFDEIDAGVSGATSEKMGRMLAELSKTAQVFCVTHSPQIASLAENHLLIRKTEIDGRSESFVSELDRDGRIEEITRIIGGIEITDAQRKAAAEMLDSNKDSNKNEGKGGE